MRHVFYKPMKFQDLHRVIYKHFYRIGDAQYEEMEEQLEKNWKI